MPLAAGPFIKAGMGGRMFDKIPGDQSALNAMVETVLALARRYGASESEVNVNEGVGYSVNVRMGEVETVEHQQNKRLDVTVYLDKQKGSASTTDLRPEAIEQTVRSACQIASHAGSDACAGLADPQYLATEVPDLDLYHPWPIDPQDAIDIALTIENTARECDRRITNSEGASVSVKESVRVYGNSLGFLGGYRSSRHAQSCVVIGEDSGGMQRDYWYTTSRVPDELEVPEQVGLRAAERALHRLGARRLATLNAPVIFSAEVATGLIGHFINAITGTHLYRQASFLVDRLGERVFTEGFSLREEPRRPRGISSAPFDAQGVATQTRDIVIDGCLEGYVLDSYAARKLNSQTTGNAGGVRNVVVRSDSGDLTELLSSMERGLLVTELIGMGINLVTGDYSRGAAGFWVEGGEIQYPVHEITVAGNLNVIFKNICAVGRDVDRRGNIHTGSILVENMIIAGH